MKQGGIMLTREKITREELYEAVWKEPVQKVAASLGLSDVGLAKIAKKLHMPVPGRGYWAKGPMERKLLRIPLPWARPSFQTTFRSTQTTASEQQQKGHETTQRLLEAGVVLPTVDEAASGGILDPILEESRPRLLASGLDAGALRNQEVCADITVSPERVDRALRIFQFLKEAFQRSGFELEVLPPNLSDRASPVASRTGVLILDCFVAFELREAYINVELPPPPVPEAKAKRGRWSPETMQLPPPKQYRKEGLGTLTLSIVDPIEWGVRRFWRDTKRHRLEESLNGFLLTVCDLAQRRHAHAVQAELECKENEARRIKAEAEKKHQTWRTQRIFDLDSRLEDCQEALRIRDFVSRVKQERVKHADHALTDPEFESWQAWATALADELETEAIQTLSRLRDLSKEETRQVEQSSWRETQLRTELDLWQRRYIFGRHR